MQITSSAAAEGVGARKSATKSAIVKSVSCPTAEITGTGRGRNRARHALLVERPQVFERATAARHDHHFRPSRDCAEIFDARGDLFRRSLALHLRRIQPDVTTRDSAAPERAACR